MSDNIVKKTCKELGITQKELADMLEVSQPTISEWQKGNIPKMARMALELLLENKQLKNKLDGIRQFKELIQTI
jgi:transcriptional regulator with XRE-family HTH domain